MVGLLQGFCSILSGKRNDTCNDAEVDGRLGVSLPPGYLLHQPVDIAHPPIPTQSLLARKPDYLFVRLSGCTEV